MLDAKATEYTDFLGSTVDYGIVAKAVPENMTYVDHFLLGSSKWKG